MKKFSVSISALFGIVILIAIALQSSDAIGHLRTQFTEKQCHHHYTKGKNEINHSHHHFEKCFVCEFTFSHFLSADVLNFHPKLPKLHSGYTASRSREITQFFRGSLFSHRGPPQRMV